jgi:nucleoside-diphosphate-sugar epimerase
MSNKNPLLLVTGGAGYVGSTFMRDALSEGYRIRCLDLLVYGGRSIIGLMNHPDFELKVGDVRNKIDVEQALEDVDAVVHLAGIVGDLPCQVAPRSSYQINFQGTELLAETAKRKGVERFIFASTCSTYGVLDTSTPADESRPLNPVSLYAEAKIDCEKMLVSLKNNTFHPTMLRYGTAYGISFRTRFDLLINSFAYEALTEEKIVVFAANMWRPYVHVRDMGVIMLNVLKAPVGKISGEIFNAGATEHNHTKKEVVEMFQDILPDLEVQYVVDVDDKRDYRVTCKKLEQAVRFKATRDVRSGIKELVFCFQNKILTKDDYESNNLEQLKSFFAAKEETLSI